MKIKNFVGGHAILFFALAQCVYDDKNRKYIVSDGEKHLFRVLPEPNPLRADIKETPCNSEKIMGFDVPQAEQRIISCDPMPALADDEIAVVSLLYMTAAKQQGWDTSKLRTITPCYGYDGKPCGFVKLNF